MPGARARRLCPDLLFVRPRFEVYRAVSAQVREVFSRFTDIIQPLSLDEAYLDVTRNKPGIPSATRIAEEIRRLIREETGLTASAGVSYNKLIRSEEHTSELQSLMRISYAVFCLKKKKTTTQTIIKTYTHPKIN